MSNTDRREGADRDTVDRDSVDRDRVDRGDAAPGDSLAEDFRATSGIRGYMVGLFLAALLTAASFLLPLTGWVWAPAVGPALIALAMAQIAVHLAFFLHVTTGPDNTNNVIALAFGLLVVGLVVLGSIWIMAHLNHNMMPMQQM